MKRYRRLRKSQILRDMVKDVELSIDDFVYPLFIEEGENIKTEIKSMPGQFRFSLDRLEEELSEIKELGIKSVLLFGIPKSKDECGTESYNEKGIVQEAIRYIKKNHPKLLIIADLCMCEYTSHGHCGIIKNNEVDNDATIEILAKIALTYANAGVDIIAPSDMMDGRVFRIRKELDENGYKNLTIMSYSVKYSSSFYGPFREAADSAPQFGDRKQYQMDYRRKDEAYLEAKADIEEGADIIMVKPALAYLDIIAGLKNRFNHPIAAYSVSGEYSMVKAASINGWIDEKAVVLEQMTAIKRAGADIIITYFAKDIAKYLKR